MLAATAGVIASVWFTSIFGDGFSEFVRHLHLGISAALASWLLQAGAIARRRMPALIELAVALLIAALFAAALGRLALAYGVSSQPAIDAVGPGEHLMAGVVISPFGAQRIEIRRQGSLLGTATAIADAEVSRHFPLNSGTAGYRYSATIQLENSSEPAAVEVILIDARGKAQLIERRWLH